MDLIDLMEDMTDRDQDAVLEIVQLAAANNNNVTVLQHRFDDLVMEHGDCFCCRFPFDLLRWGVDNNNVGFIKASVAIVKRGLPENSVKEITNTVFYNSDKNHLTRTPSTFFNNEALLELIPKNINDFSSLYKYLTFGNNSPAKTTNQEKMESWVHNVRHSPLLLLSFGDFLAQRGAVSDAGILVKMFLSYEFGQPNEKELLRIFDEGFLSMLQHDFKGSKMMFDYLAENGVSFEKLPNTYCIYMKNEITHALKGKPESKSSSKKKM